MHLARRHFLALASGTALVSVLPVRVAFATAPTEQRFVLIVLRGAMDGLAAVPPLGDVDYAAQRGRLAFSSDEVLPLDDFYALNPNLPTFAEWYGKGEGLVVHAVATPYRDRSHFDAQDLLENGSDQAHALKDGWLNRTLAALGGDGRLGLATNQEVPLVMRGSSPVITWSPEGLASADSSFLDRIEDLYADDPLLSYALAEGREVDKLADGALADQDRMLRGPGQVADGAGRLLAEPAGPRVAVLELNGWDTHSGQGTTKGRLARSMQSLDITLTALRQGLGPVWEQTVIVTVTEFGRTVRVNGNGGTDHGTGTASLLAGGAVRGGRVQADWPGLADQALLENRDLAPTQDLRGVLKGVLGPHLGLGGRALEDSVFPDSAAAPPLEGLLRA